MKDNVLQDPITVMQMQQRQLIYEQRDWCTHQCRLTLLTLSMKEHIEYQRGTLACRMCNERKQQLLYSVNIKKKTETEHVKRRYKLAQFIC